jgi:hypothetical protein
MRMIFEGDPQGKEEIGKALRDLEYAAFEKIVSECKQ